MFLEKMWSHFLGRCENDLLGKMIMTMIMVIHHVHDKHGNNHDANDDGDDHDDDDADVDDQLNIKYNDDHDLGVNDGARSHD